MSEESYTVFNQDSMLIIYLQLQLYLKQKSQVAFNLINVALEGYSGMLPASGPDHIYMHHILRDLSNHTK